MNRSIVLIVIAVGLAAAGPLEFCWTMDSVKSVEVKTIVGGIDIEPAEPGAGVTLSALILRPEGEAGPELAALCDCKPELVDGVLKLRADVPDDSDLAIELRLGVPAGIPVRATCGTGDIKTAGLDQRLRLTTVRGDITVLEHRGPVSTDAAEGGVECRVERLGEGDTLELETIRGEVYVMVPPGVDATFDAYTTAGRIDFNYLKFECDEREDDRARGRLGTGIEGWGRAHVITSSITGDVRYYGAP